MVKNPFNINDPKYVMLNHIITNQDALLPQELISIETYYQHGIPVAPLFSPGEPQFIYMCSSFHFFRDDQIAQMVYQIEDENGFQPIVVADTISTVGPALWQSHIRQENFILRSIIVIAAITYWEFIGWRLTLKT